MFKGTFNILLLSSDQHWNDHFLETINAFLNVNLFHASHESAAENILLETEVDLIILGAPEPLTLLKKFKEISNKSQTAIALLKIMSKEQSLEAAIKIGADFASYAQDAFVTEHYIRMAMAIKKGHQKALINLNKAHSTTALYYQLYQNFNIPICYVSEFGSFLDANDAFLKSFLIGDKAKLEEITAMTLVQENAKTTFRDFISKVFREKYLEINSLELQNLNKTPLLASVHASNVIFREKNAIQMVFFEENKKSLDSSLSEPQNISKLADWEQLVQSKDFGCINYLWLRNYRNVLQKDGYQAAEALFNSVELSIRDMERGDIEMFRATDDAILFWLNERKEDAFIKFKALLKNLDALIPDNIAHIVHPECYLSVIPLDKKSSFNEIITRSVRTVYALAHAEKRIEEALPRSITKNEAKKVFLIKELIENGKIANEYQPIIGLKNSSFKGYADILSVDLEDNPNSILRESGVLDLESLSLMVDKEGLGRMLAKAKISQLINDASEIQDKKGYHFLISLAKDAVIDKHFIKWLDEYLKENHWLSENLVFDIKIDTIIDCFSQTREFIENVKARHIRFSISNIAYVTSDILKVLNQVKPDILKISIEGLEHREGEEIESSMEKIKSFANRVDALLIAEKVVSVAQLLLVWQYQIGYLQGPGVVEAARSLDYDFSRPLF